VKKIVQGLGGRLVAMVLPPIQAGACVPERGQCCSARGYRFDCNGICQRLRCGCGWYPVGC
jgi:hypothetical protein